MSGQSDSQSSSPNPDRDDSSTESAEQQSAPAVEAEATVIGPYAVDASEGRPTDVDGTDTGRSASVADADPEMTLEQNLECILAEFAQTLVPEHQDLNQTLAQTSLKPAFDSNWMANADGKSLSASGSARVRSIRPADQTGTGSDGETLVEPETSESSLDYVTLTKLGEGGMGTVHLARQVALGREVALKQIHQRSSQKDSVRDEFLTEAVLTGKLEHPNIVPIYEVGESAGGELFYSMKNVKGRAWDDTIDGLSLRENLKILIDVCDAMAFAHAEGVIHRDLKPQNIMTGGFGEVLVLDWGMAVLAAPGEDVKASAGGTPCYMAPEMINPPFLVGPRSDVYLLGAILFRFLTGQTPHAGKSAMSSLKAASKNEIIAPDAERMQSLDPTGELLGVALQAMATDPADRYQTVGEFQQAVREFEAHQESLTLAARAAYGGENAKRSAVSGGRRDYTAPR
jgi:serine/threonine protein kinase